jgi:integrase
MPRRNAQPHYNERPNADGSISRFVYPTINGKPCWRKIPEDGKWDGLRGYRRFLAKVIEEETNKNEGSKVTFEAVALKWLNVRQRTRAAGTAYLDSKNLHSTLIPRFGAKRYSEIERDDVQQMVFDLIPERLQRSTMQHILKTFRMVIKWQCRNDKIVYNADLTADLEYPRIDPNEDEAREGRALTVDEINALLEALPPQWHSLIQIMILTGLRIGEALAMQWKYYHKDGNGAGYYEVERQLNFNRDLVTPKTDGSRARVRLGAKAIAILDNHRTTQAKLRLRYPNWLDHDDPHIFPAEPIFTDNSQTTLSRYQPTDLGQVLNSTQVRRHLHRATTAAGLGTIRPHDFRHTHASMLIAKGANIKAVSHRLRHTSIQTTLNIYGHLYPDDQQAVADIADQVFKFEQNCNEKV